MATLESASIWIRDNCNLERLKRIRDIQNPKVLEILDLIRVKPLLYLGLAFVLFCAIVHRKVQSRAKKPAPRTRSPDPEKPFGTGKPKEPERPFGGKLVRFLPTKLLET